MKIITHGKCILAGEHAVIRGQPALVTPLKSRSFRLEWGDFSPIPSDLQSHFERTLRIALERIGKTSPHGFRASSDIPSRAGLGSSAALSVAITQYLEREGLALFGPEERFRFALELENIFHGTSSGIDVAAALSPGILRFQQGKAEKLNSDWQPHLFLSDTGLRSSTKACVEKVVSLQRADLDQKMGQATMLAISSFESRENAKLALALNEARGVFSEWNLIPAEVKKLEDSLFAKGAIAVKPTGSGDGGFLLSLWNEPPEGENLFSIWADSSKSL